VTEVAVEFKKDALPLFGPTDDGAMPNILILRIQPERGITTAFCRQAAGASHQDRDVNMDFRYGTSFGVPTPEAYERLLLDAMLGDTKLLRATTR